jgi:hypothetical protein
MHSSRNEFDDEFDDDDDADDADVDNDDDTEDDICELAVLSVGSIQYTIANAMMCVNVQFRLAMYLTMETVAGMLYATRHRLQATGRSTVTDNCI